jgi:hypothetical protein
MAARAGTHGLAVMTPATKTATIQCIDLIDLSP